MLKKLLTKPVELTIDGKAITFKSIDDFKFALDARSAVPLEKVTEALKSTPSELDLESNAIVIAIEQITELLDQTSESGEITQSLKAINPVIFSNDNDWRDIFFALKKDHSANSSKYKQLALTAYLQYLSNRQEMIQIIKAKSEQDNELKGKSEAPEFRTGELDIDDNFDSKVLAKELGMNNMPTAEYVVLEINAGEEIALLLANYQCKLIVKEGIKFVDHENIEHPIMIGMNKIGRGRECKVRFTDTTQRISRLHLIIINHDNKKLELTDLSTYGTHYLKKTI
jgi:FHA domain-containing protein